MNEELSYIRATVENALAYTQPSTVIVLHIDSTVAILQDASDFEWLWSEPRVLVNCQRLRNKLGLIRILYG